MVYFAGLDVSVKATSVCVVDDAGKVILEQKVPTEPAEIIAVLTSLGVPFGRIGIEAGPLSQRLVNALTAAELPVICVETRHMKALLTAQQPRSSSRCSVSAGSCAISGIADSRRKQLRCVDSGPSLAIERAAIQRPFLI